MLSFYSDLLLCIYSSIWLYFVLAVLRFFKFQLAVFFILPSAFCSDSKNGKYEEAVKIYEMLPSEKSFDVACGLGLALLKAGQPDKSIEST